MTVRELISQLSGLNPGKVVRVGYGGNEATIDEVADTQDGVVLIGFIGTSVDAFCPHGHLDRDDCPICG